MEATYAAVDAAEDALRRLRRSVGRISLKKFRAARYAFHFPLNERMALHYEGERFSIQELLEFVRDYSKIDRKLREDMKTLFDYRNDLVHAKAIMVESEKEVPESDTLRTRTVETYKMSKVDVERAEWCTDVAARARAALGAAFKDLGWKFER